MPCPVEGCHFTGVVTWQMTRHMEDKHGGSHQVDSLTFPAPEAKTCEERNLENQPSKRNDWARENGYQMGNSRKTGGYLTKYYEITHDPITKRRQYHCTMVRLCLVMTCFECLLLWNMITLMHHVK